MGHLWWRVLHLAAPLDPRSERRPPLPAVPESAITPNSCAASGSTPRRHFFQSPAQIRCAIETPASTASCSARDYPAGTKAGIVIPRASTTSTSSASARPRKTRSSSERPASSSACERRELRRSWSRARCASSTRTASCTRAVMWRRAMPIIRTSCGSTRARQSRSSVTAKDIVRADLRTGEQNRRRRRVAERVPHPPRDLQSPAGRRRDRALASRLRGRAFGGRPKRSSRLTVDGGFLGGPAPIFDDPGHINTPERGNLASGEAGRSRRRRPARPRNCRHGSATSKKR